MPALPIDGHTQLVGLIGWPVEHSMSPAMHNAAFESLGLNWRYVPLPVEPGQVEAALRGLAALGFHGANVTVPHKEAVMPALQVVGGDAQALGAVNTVVVRRDEDGSATVSGHNTDAAGFIGALRDSNVEAEGARAVVVGAGGAARAVVFGLMGAGAEEISVLNRTLERAQGLVSDLEEIPLPCGALHSCPATLQALSLSAETLTESTRSADLLINATPAGMWPHVDGSIWPDSVPIPAQLVVFDLVYNPLETRLLLQARRSGARGVGGLGMLVRQGALAFKLWTGVEAPVGVMRRVCERSLRS
jgi:shikimate dehydrogenase